MNTLAQKAWYREPWPWILMSGPLLVIVAGFVTAWLAFTHNDGLVAEDYYKQGLAVNQVLKREDEAQRLGLRADLMRSGKQLRILLTGSTDYRPSPAISLRIVHPTRAGEDQLLTLTADGQGFYSGPLQRDIAGRWSVTIEDIGASWRLRGSWQMDAEVPQHLVAKVEPAANGR